MADRLISADAVKEYVREQVNLPLPKDRLYMVVPIEDFITNLIDNAPTAEPKRGRWITVSDGYGNGVATASICECSLCKDTIWVYKNDKRKWKFCPHCGATMDLDEVEE